MCECMNEYRMYTTVHEKITDDDSAAEVYNLWQINQLTMHTYSSTICMYDCEYVCMYDLAVFRRIARNIFDLFEYMQLSLYKQGDS